ncbi:hypothetical protein [Candidatus Poriferisodalis sp.]|uniref:hypothetical protein n=1 Tax=Candidatus Poriferisodalis sp. TaxID=3101277 RepID=UPI003B01344C
MTEPPSAGWHTVHRRLGRLVAILTALCVACASCGDGAVDAPEAPLDGRGGAASGGPDDPALARSVAGIDAAGGDAAALEAAVCDLNRALRIAYVGPDLGDLEAVGLGSLVIEGPVGVIEAYLTEVNAHGGIRGRCVQFSIHRWSWSAPGASFGRVCADVPVGDPIIVLGLFGDVRGVQCLAVDAQIPMLGVAASVPATVQRRSRGRLFLDDGTAGYLLASSIAIAQGAELFTENSQIGLLYGPPVGASPDRSDYNIGADFDEIVELTGSANLIPGVITHVPAGFGLLSLVGAEDRVGLLRQDLTPAEQAAAQSAMQAVPESEAALLADIEDFYLAEAAKQRDAGVATVFATAPWFELRRMMRAAELVGWHPRWIANDIQGATLTLTGAPEAQAANFYMVSAKRAAGDVVADLDRGCVRLRNSLPGASTFSHRPHSDAWSLLVETCDALDVVVAALSRIDGPFSREALIDQLVATDYDAGYGGRIRFGPGDFSAADRFRVLRADPHCLLDEWGCMRAVTDWAMPSNAPAQGSA